VSVLPDILTDERANETGLGGTDGFSSSQGIPRYVYNSMFYYYVDKEQLPTRLLSH
jgi:hypothetical protein